MNRPILVPLVFYLIGSAVIAAWFGWLVYAILEVTK